MPSPALPSSLSPYGADEHGLICGYLFEPGAAPQTIDAPGALERLQRASEGTPTRFIWLHFNLSHAGSEPWLREHADQAEPFFDLINQQSKSTRLQREGDALFAVVNDITFDFDFEPSDTSTLWISATQQLVITARRHPLRAIDRLRAAVKRGEALPSAVALLDHLLRDQADELLGICRRTSDHIDDIEDAMLAHKPGHRTAELGRLRRVMVRLQRLLAPDPGTFARVLSHPPAWMSVDDAQCLRHSSEEFGVVLRDLVGLQERIKLLQEEAAARVAEENNRSLFVLTLVTVLALPINLVAGLLGMNVGGVPFNQHPHGFWWVIVLVVGATAGIGAWLVRRLAPKG